LLRSRCDAGDFKPMLIEIIAEPKVKLAFERIGRARPGPPPRCNFLFGDPFIQWPKSSARDPPHGECRVRVTAGIDPRGEETMEIVTRGAVNLELFALAAIVLLLIPGPAVLYIVGAPRAGPTRRTCLGSRHPRRHPRSCFRSRPGPVGDPRILRDSVQPR
jgi:hypothetical protein